MGLYSIVHRHYRIYMKLDSCSTCSLLFKSGYMRSILHVIRTFPRPPSRVPHRRASLPGIHAWLLLMMSTNAGFKLAPPTRKPSISGCLASSLLFFSVTLPPYRIRVFSAASEETSFFSHSRIAAWTSCACSVVATLPVPMALVSVSGGSHHTPV
jgi:hypothetical protein